MIKPTPTPDTTNTVITLPFAQITAIPLSTNTLFQPELLLSPLVTYNTTPQSMSPGIMTVSINYYTPIFISCSRICNQ